FSCRHTPPPLSPTPPPPPLFHLKFKRGGSSLADASPSRLNAHGGPPFLLQTREGLLSPTPSSSSLADAPPPLLHLKFKRGGLLSPMPPPLASMPPPPCFKCRGVFSPRRPPFSLQTRGGLPALTPPLLTPMPPHPCFKRRGVFSPRHPSSLQTRKCFIPDQGACPANP